jgi:uncharacterized protein YdeI (YjbR/CyaY-like superfamily)
LRESFIFYSTFGFLDGLKRGDGKEVKLWLLGGWKEGVLILFHKGKLERG